MNNISRLASLFILLVGFSLVKSGAAQAALQVEVFHTKPKLVLVLVVDQFRADYLTRYAKRFLPAEGKSGDVGGYGWLMKRGAYFPFAEYDALQCMTGPGHAMISSGAYPYQMKIPLNYWWDRETGKAVYCTEDAASPIVGHESKKAGMSPRNFVGTTLGDELKNAGYPARVVSIALKDRAAVLMGGKRADFALWFEPKPFKWLSSKYYVPNEKLPAWVDKLNADIAAKKDQAYVWEVGQDPLGLTVNPNGFKRESTYGGKESTSWPFGLEITATAAEAAIDEFKLGRGKATDLLMVSFSAHDYLGHHLGPNSLEMQEMTVVEDRLIAKLLNKIRKTTPGGLKDVVVVLTGDHGIPPKPEWAKENRIDAGEVPGVKLKEKIEARLDAKFGKPKSEWLPFTWDLNYFISPWALKETKAKREDVEIEIKEELKTVPGVAYVFTRTDYENHRLPPGIFERQILKTYVPARNGDVIAIPQPFFQNEEAGYATTHMTGYTYDRTVPIVFAGMKIKPGVHATKAEVVDIAPTLAFILGILKPAGSDGRVLGEIFQ